MGNLVMAYDVGTTGIKTCIFDISNKIQLVHSALEGYDLHVINNGGIEQNPLDWWEAMCHTTKKVLSEACISGDEIQGISFCAQMQGLVLVDNKGNPVRPAMSYMDNRAVEEIKTGLKSGLKIAGINLIKLIKSITISGVVPASVKDPIWKYKWVENNEPAIYKKIYRWLDVKEFLICKCTNNFVMTEDSAFATLLYDTRKNKHGFSKEICKLFGVNMDHLPKVIKSTDVAGQLTQTAALALGLTKDIPVFGGGGDASLIGLGAGVAKEGGTHIYLGTSGWVSTIVNKQILDLRYMIASIIGADKGRFNYFAELETAGKCLEWVKDHLALDEINVYLDKKTINDSKEAVYKSMYDYMMYAIKDIPAGSNGVIFTPWLHGNRCPFEDPKARGMYFNISLETGKTELIHAVIEGICFHLRWQLEASERKVKTSSVIRLVGGGALAPLTCQILADITGRTIETVENPQNVGAVGAAILCAVGLGIIDSIETAESLIIHKNCYIPNTSNKTIYDTNYKVYKKLYPSNKVLFHELNSKRNTP